MINYPIVIANTCMDIRDGTHDSPSFVSNGIPLVTSKNLKNGYIDFSECNYITQEDHENFSKRSLVENGDILYAMIGTIGNPVIVNTDKVFSIKNVALFKFNQKDKIFNRYFYHFLNSEIAHKQLAQLSRGGTQKFVSLGNLRNLEIPLPPLEEQRRIASILDKADDIRQKRQQAIAKLDELLQATFIDMFGDPLDNPKKYQMMTLGSISSFENGDRSNNYPSGADVVQEGIPFLSTKNIKGNIFDSSNMQFITQEKFNKLSRGKVSNGDILITLRGTLGSTCIYEYEYPQAFINAQMMIIRANQNFMSNRFLHIILSSEAMQKYLKSIGNGAAVQQLTATQLKNISIITPDRNNQEIFIKFYESLQNQKSLLKRALNNADDFFKSLQHRAFNETL